jgi:hypothetical protein
MAAGLFRCRMYADWSKFRSGWKRIYTEAADRRPRRLAQWAWRSRWLGTLVPAWTQVAGVCGAVFVARGLAEGWMLLALWLFATALWLGSLARIAVMSRAPAWTAPLHIVGAWLTARLLSEAARDLRSRRTTSWGGRDYDLGVKRA